MSKQLTDMEKKMFEIYYNRQSINYLDLINEGKTTPTMINNTLCHMWNGVGLVDSVYQNLKNGLHPGIVKKFSNNHLSIGADGIVLNLKADPIRSIMDMFGVGS